MNYLYYDETKSDYLIWREGSGGTVEIYDLHVSGEHRREGRGRVLVDLLLDRYKPKDCHLVFAITRQENFVAQQFYESMRFRVVAVLRDFYRSDDGKRSVAIMYGRDIGSQA